MPDGIGLGLGALAASFEAKVARFTARVHQEAVKATQAQMLDIHRVIVLTSPVDTGALRASWPLPTQRGNDLIWGTGTTLDYAPTLEYGGYTHEGPRTQALGGGALGYGFQAEAGIYSTQAPLGFVRKALAAAAPQYALRLQNIVKAAWDGDQATVTFTGGSNRILGEI